MGVAAMTGGARRPDPLPADQRLKVGLVGAGVISGQYLESIARLADVDLVAVADLDVERAAATAAEHGARALTVAQLLDDPEVDTVLNLTIPAAHAEVCAAALEAGKNVYVEKPLAMTVDDGRALVALAARQGLRLGAAPDTVLGTGIQTARAVIDEGRIGTPVAATAFWASAGHERWHPNPDFYYQPGGGPLFDMGPYYVSALVTLLGPVVRVTASASRSARPRTIGDGPRAGSPIAVEVDTHVTALLTHADGAVSTVTVSFEVWGSRQPRIEVYGTEGALQAPDPNRFDGAVEVVDVTGGEWMRVPDLAGYVAAGRGYGLADLAVSAAESRPHRASAELGLHVLDVMATMLEASTAGSVLPVTTTTERPAAVPLLDLRDPR